MKKILLITLICLFWFSSCSTAVYTLGDVLPELIDVTTQDPYVESVTVFETESQRSVTFTDGITHNNIRMQFEGIECTREKSKKDYPSLYTVTFSTTNGDVKVYIVSNHEFIINGYLYKSIALELDLVYFEHLFS